MKIENHQENIFCEYTIKSWNDCRNLFEYIKNWVFRGQSNSSWSLQTTLERGSLANNSDMRKIPIIEKNIISKFQRRAFQYIEKVPEKDDVIEWLSLLQHHGGSTRLLDFSYSYYVALFFSTDNALQESAVYCLNKELIYDKGLETEIWRGLKNKNIYGTKEYCNQVLKDQVRSPLVMLIEPFNLHERLSRQQGLFAVPFEGQQSFEYNLSLTVNRYQKALPKSKKIDDYNDLIDMLNEECALLKVKIPQKFHNEIRRDLKLMNITNETLFPGIDGFAKSLSEEFDI
ncbi:FRG domain-containing protein [Gottschalkia acidurici 9a]|uniref:FRG domain-containing protein n=1 Tax=Gottschalkia acidurici (strain ATCC 7906 / DSM 604 / BCRC 14475 / CIP 104303 / KCTC 5404 / NCIMB 10678 / 9a) TaxID=1128398 RepID=K0B0E2_GOTA9|nr:FRG domain-containing protein [Gottschalkia acidurici]AFS78116.1 FRG domain-containing protein [Gottschalkia acidurici 9a]